MTDRYTLIHKHTHAAPDHIQVRQYHPGEVYRVGSHYMPTELADTFEKEKWASPTPKPASSPQSAGDGHIRQAHADALRDELDAQPVHHSVEHEHGLVGHFPHLAAPTHLNADAEARHVARKPTEPKETKA